MGPTVRRSPHTFLLHPCCDRSWCVWWYRYASCSRDGVPALLDHPCGDHRESCHYWSEADLVHAIFPIWCPDWASDHLVWLHLCRGHGTSGLTNCRFQVCIPRMSCPLPSEEFFSSSVLALFSAISKQYFRQAASLSWPRPWPSSSTESLSSWYLSSWSHMGSLLSESPSSVAWLTKILIVTNTRFPPSLCLLTPLPHPLQELQSSPYGEEDYYQLNFNDLPNGFVLLFTCIHVSGWDTISSGFSAVTNEFTGRIYFSLWYIVGVLLLMNVITSFFISAFILKINSWNFGGNSETASASSSSPSGDDNPPASKPFLRTNVLSIKQSSLDETALEYPTDDYHNDLSFSRNSFQMIIDNSKTAKEKRYLSNLSLRYSSAINNERFSEVKSLLTSAAAGPGNSSGSYRINFIVDAENVRDLSDGELMVIIHRMMDEKKASASLLR